MEELFFGAAYKGSKSFTQQEVRTANATGFGAAADDYAEKGIDLNEQLIRNKPATFFFRMKGDAMTEAGIFEGDVLIVDRSVKLSNGKIIIAVLNGELLVRRYHQNFTSSFLIPGNSRYKPINLSEFPDFKIWGGCIICHSCVIKMTAIIDCNSFYCSCEQLFLPALKDKPVVVLSNNDGCIVSRTDEAKALGIGMGEPYFQNKEKIHQHNIAVFSSNYHLYGDISRRVMDTLRHLVGIQEVEVYSVDEAFVDLRHIPPSSLDGLADKIKKVTEQWTGIPVSVGIAPTKVLSKVANRLAKKNKKATGCIKILRTKEEIRQALEQTPVGDIWGIGRRYTYLLQEMYGIETAYQLSQMNEGWVQKNLGGVVGQRLLRELKGEPCIEMKDPLEKKKMIATARMFGKPVTQFHELKEAVATYVTRAAEKLRRQYGAAETIHVFVIKKPTTSYNAKYYREQNSASATLPLATNDTRKLIAYALPLVQQLFEEGRIYVKAGVILSDIIPDASIQGNLFYASDNPADKQLLKAMDNINFGVREDLVRFGSAGTTRNWKMRQEHRSKKYTTRWNELFEIP